MWGLALTVQDAVEAYRANQRDGRKQPQHMNVYREACHRFGATRTQRAFVRAYLREAAKYFADGKFAAGRRFFDGAFQFGSHEMLGQLMLNAALRTARRAYQTGDHLVVWNLMEAVRRLAWRGLDTQAVISAFEEAGIPLDRLQGAPRSVTPSFVAQLVAA